MAHQPPPDDSELEGFQFDPPASSDGAAGYPVTSEEIWNTYFEGGCNKYEGLDEEWIQGRVSANRATVGLHNSLDPIYRPPQQRNRLIQSPEQRTSAFDHDYARVSAEELKSPNLTRSEILSTNIIRDEPGQDGAQLTRQSGVDNDTHSSHFVQDHNHNYGFIYAPAKASISEPSHNFHLQNDKGQGTRVCTEGQSPPAFRSDRSREGLLGTLRQEADDILRVPVFSPFASQAKFPVGVEEAKSAYDQGLLSTGTFFRDCLPPALLYTKDSPTSDADDLTMKRAATLGRKHELTQESNPAAARPRNLARQESLRRNSQAPLAAICEEECSRHVCQDVEEGQKLIWFHLCPRFEDLAEEKRFRNYTSYEGRVIIHHGQDTSSIGLILQKDMPDNFAVKTTTVNSRGVVGKAVLNPIQTPEPIGLGISSEDSDRGWSTSRLSPTTSKPLPIATHSLQRPIPLGASQPSSLSTSGPRLGYTDSLATLTPLHTVDFRDRHACQTSHYEPQLRYGVAPQTPTAERTSLTLLSPSAGHETTPSEYLSPSTSSAVSVRRNSFTSHSNSPSQNEDLTQEGVTSPAKHRAEARDPFVTPEKSNGKYKPEEQPSTESSYCTAQGTQYPSSSSSPPVTVHTAPSPLRRDTHRGHTQYFSSFQSQDFDVDPASIHPALRPLGSLHVQQNSDGISGTTLLNGSAFGSGLVDPFGTPGATEFGQRDTLASGSGFPGSSSNNNSDAVHGTHLPVASAIDVGTLDDKNLNADRRASVSMGQGIANYFSRLSRTSLCVNPTRPGTAYYSSGDSNIPSPDSGRPSYASDSTRSPPTPPSRRRHRLPQDLDSSRKKAESVLGLYEPLSPPSSSAQRQGRFATWAPGVSTSATRQWLEEEAGSDGEERAGLTRIVRKGSRAFRDGGAKLVGKWKAGWRVRSGEWLHSDDGAD
ncbi:MAG: hypothetical protein Q9219_002629 [cf. Caloplaca sp. 3 TL-2023]